MDTDLWAFWEKYREEKEKEAMNIAVVPSYQNLSLTDFMTSMQVISMLCVSAIRLPSWECF